MKKLLLIISILVIGLVVVGCSSNNQNNLLTSPYKETEFLLGTVVTVKVYDEDKEEALETVFERIKFLSSKIDPEADGSEVEKINDNAGVAPVAVSEGMFDLIEAGKAHSENAEGSFDISIGPLTSLWHIGFDDAKKPDQQEIDAVLPLINYEQVELNKEESTVYLTEKGMKLDLGAIAKGYIADEIVSVLKEHEVTTAIVDLGGNIYVLGNHPSGDEWTVGIQNPFLARGEIVGKLKESNKSIVTSGIYERYLEVDGKKYHHLLNPKDGYPYFNEIAGVSIISDKSIDGDALSTVVFSKGLKDGMDYIEQVNGTEAIFVSIDKKVYVTEGLKDVFELTNEEFTMDEF